MARQILCDRCGVIIAEHVKSLVVNTFDPLPRRLNRPIIDLCAACGRSFEDWLSAASPPSPQDDDPHPF
jgi:hypothetical protein